MNSSSYSDYQTASTWAPPATVATVRLLTPVDSGISQLAFAPRE